ncbi:hypothetical protein T10_10882 [Trichinella papuae]|uniref:Uncharacterized protein n=1 Tax=Trichinella papuae TaxID=268474 RepID=A0A0V1MNV3_9BILA|nr:hypothetical protein T10_10882 [Trichinella papuae]
MSQKFCIGAVYDIAPFSVLFSWCWCAFQTHCHVRPSDVKESPEVTGVGCLSQISKLILDYALAYLCHESCLALTYQLRKAMYSLLERLQPFSFLFASSSRSTTIFICFSLSIFFLSCSAVALWARVNLATTVP